MEQYRKHLEELRQYHEFRVKDVSQEILLGDTRVETKADREIHKGFVEMLGELLDDLK